MIHVVGLIYGVFAITRGVIRLTHPLVRRLQPMWARCKANATKGFDR